MRRGRRPEESAGLRGSLSLMSLSALLSHLEAERAGGRLTLKAGRWPGPARLELRDGALLRARVDGLPSPRNAELVYALLAESAGEFDFRPGAVAGGNEIETPVTALLLEGARRLDERRAAASA